MYACCLLGISLFDLDCCDPLGVHFHLVYDLNDVCDFGCIYIRYMYMMYMNLWAPIILVVFCDIYDLLDISWLGYINFEVLSWAADLIEI